MTKSSFVSSFDNASVASCDLFSIVEELSARRMLGRLDLVTDATPSGFLLISPLLTAELIKTFSALPCDGSGRHTSIVFGQDHLSLYILDGSFLSFNELVHIARISSLAGFDKKQKNGSSIEFCATITPSEEHYLYAISRSKLRDIFKRYFPQL